MDTRNSGALREAMSKVDGVVHLAAISRVVWAQRDPGLARSVNVGPLNVILDAALARGKKPWVIFGSSREVYGDASVLPVSEDAAVNPMNVYARTKLAGEALVAVARDAGLTANVVRFSNVYGRASDHPDRVVPAFAREAAFGGSIRVEGAGNVFDFTHVDDVADGLTALIDATSAGDILPPMHFASGIPTTLGHLANLALKHSRHPVGVVSAQSRDFDVARFYGDPGRAKALLGWQHTRQIEDGIVSLIETFAARKNNGSANEADQTGRFLFGLAATA